MAHVNWNSWKIATIGLTVAMATVLVATLVGGSWNKPEAAKAAPSLSKAKARQVAAPASKSSPATGRVRHAPGGPSASDIEDCNTHANSVTVDETTEVFKDPVVGGVIGAGVGLASGAIAGGGTGAGRGAAFGGIVGATAGTLYGLNEANKRDARAVEAYRSCMSQRGYSS